ncbi:MAG: SDR family oxidoreductase [Rhodobacteraceae bacterium]|nr:SDR family oxidoreductase [Paracoccaceae bacterium]
MADLNGKTVLITGASRGIGEAAAREFGAQGANVVLAARSLDAVSAIADEIGDKAQALACDVSDRNSVEAAVAQAVARFGGLDILINNAGILAPIGHIGDTDPDDWGHVIDVNIKGVLYGIHAALPHMSKGGTIITIGSGAASSALEGWSAYCTSKAAVHHLNACLDREYRSRGIRALVLSPGTVATQMQRDIKASGMNPVAAMDWSDHIPPEWPARALVWMCTRAANDFLGGVVALREDPIRRRIGLIK